MDHLPRLGKRELICLLLFTCDYVVFVWRGFLFLWVLGMGYVILLWHSLSLPYNYFLLWEKWCCHFFLAVLDRIHFILAGSYDVHESLDEFEIWPDLTAGFHGNR